MNFSARKSLAKIARNAKQTGSILPSAPALLARVIISNFRRMSGKKNPPPGFPKDGKGGRRRMI
jgi:hypothetical protein